MQRLHDVAHSRTVCMLKRAAKKGATLTTRSNNLLEKHQFDRQLPAMKLKINILAARVHRRSTARKSSPQHADDAHDPRVAFRLPASVCYRSSREALLRELLDSRWFHSALTFYCTGARAARVPLLGSCSISAEVAAASKRCYGAASCM